MRDKRAAAALFCNAASSVVGFIGYSAGPRLGEPFTSLGYLAFVVWSLTLWPVAVYFYQSSTVADHRLRQLTLIVAGLVVVSGTVLQTLLLLRVVTLAHTIGWNFASAGGVGLWLALSNNQARANLPRMLASLGILIGAIWMTAFVVLGALGFPSGGAQNSWAAGIGFGADATAYFAEIVWAIWLGLTLRREPREPAS